MTCFYKKREKEREGRPYRTCWVECREKNKAGVIEFPPDTHIPLKGRCIALGQTQTLGLGRTGRCKLANRPDSADLLGT